MSIELTAQQQQALDSERDEFPRLVDPRSNAVYVLVPEGEYETVREVLDDERHRQAIRAVALRNAVGRMDDCP
jgi:hypothetical protein